MYELDKFRSVIIEEKRFHTYDWLERNHRGVNRWYLSQLIHNADYQPPVWVCEKWGVIKYEPAPVCSVHGVVHCYDCAKQVVKSKPKPKQQRPRYPRYYCWLWEWAQEASK